MALRSSTPLGTPLAHTLSRIDAVPSPRFPARFRVRVFSYMVALAVGFSIASTAVYYWRQMGFIRGDRGLRSRTLLSSLATEAELGAYAGDPALCTLPALRIAQEDDVAFVMIYDRRGRELFAKVRSDVPVPPPPVVDVFKRLNLPPGELHSTFTGAATPASADSYDDLYAPILTLSRDAAVAVHSGPGGPPPRQEVVGLARVGLSKHLARAQLRETLRWGVLLGAGILLVGIFAAYLISRRVSRPIGALIRGADRIRLGDLDTRVKIESRDELGQLAYSFNRMARRLNESITALETLNRDLEAEVARRTAEVQRAGDFVALLNAPLGRRDILPDPEPPSTIVGGDAEGGLAALLDQSLAALIGGTEAHAAGAFLYPEEAAIGQLVLSRYRGAQLAAFGGAPPMEHLEFGMLYADEHRTVAPLLLGTEVLGCIVLLGMPAREDLRRFVAQAASQLAIAVGNVRAYAAADRLAHALRERNMALARQRDQLQEMNRLKSEFLANVSHELRTPLNAIIGYCELVADGIYGGVNDDQKTALAGIDDSGRNLLQLINQILDLAKVESGKMSVHLEDVDVDEVVRAVVSEAAALARDRDYRIGLPPATGIRLRTDGAKVKQILTNLVSNAVKFTLKGRVDVKVSALPDGGCSIAVQDTGIGIKPADMRIIFEEFRQVDGSYTREFGGTGLGLAIAKRFANLLGGSISVESEPGAGSTFTVALPAEAPPETARRPTRPMRIAGAVPHEVKPS